jgi:hypothetical protein
VEKEKEIREYIITRGGEGEKAGKRRSKQAADSRGAQKQGRKSGKVHQSTTPPSSDPQPGRPSAECSTRVLSSSFPSPSPSISTSPSPTPHPEPRKYFSLTPFEPYHYQWQASERRWRRSGRNRRLLRLPARSRRARPWVLAAPSSPSAGGLPTSNRQCSVRRLPHIATAPSPRILRVFSLSSPHSPGAPRLILLLLGAAAAAARHFGAGSSVLIFLPLRFFRGFCCSFSLA